MATASDDREKVNHPTEPGRLRFWWFGVWVEGVRPVFRSWVVPFGIVGFRSGPPVLLSGGMDSDRDVGAAGFVDYMVPLAGTVDGISYNFTFTGIPTSGGMPPGSRPPRSSNVGSP